MYTSTLDVKYCSKIIIDLIKKMQMVFIMLQAMMHYQKRFCNFICKIKEKN